VKLLRVSTKKPKIIRVAVTSGEVRTVRNRALDRGDRPFDNLFDDKNRLVIPLIDKDIKEIVRLLESGENKSGRAYTLDLDSGMAHFGDRKARIGKIINRELGQKYLDKWSDYQDSVNEGDNYSIVISRSPIDIMRMSDHSNISSCHSPPRGEGGFNAFHCAQEEGVSGGPVAYVVRNEDIEGLDDIGLQQEEIFYDREREIGEIEPLARIRFNRYKKIYGDEEVAIPVVAQYGHNITGFYETLQSWAMENQEEALNNFGDLRSWGKYGGSYADHWDGDILNKFFETHRYAGNAEYMGEEDPTASWEIELEHMVDHLEGKFTNLGVSAAVEDHGNGYKVYCEAEMSLIFTSKLKNPDMFNFSNHAEKLKTCRELREKTNSYLINTLEIFDERYLGLVVINPYGSEDQIKGIVINLQFQMGYENPDDFKNSMMDLGNSIDSSRSNIEVFLFQNLGDVIDNDVENSIALIDTYVEQNLQHFEIKQQKFQKVLDGEATEPMDYVVVVSAPRLHRNSLERFMVSDYAMDRYALEQNIRKTLLSPEVYEELYIQVRYESYKYSNNHGYFNCCWVIELINTDESYKYTDYETILKSLELVKEIENNIPKVDRLVDDFIRSHGGEVPETPETPETPEVQEVLEEPSEEEVKESSNWYVNFKMSRKFR
jgi:hypothetical protein